MKNVTLLGLLFLASISCNAQVDVALKINHKLDSEPFALETIAPNNLEQDYTGTRLEYYISKFSIVHDGGTETEVDLDVIALVKPGEETSTTIDLGSFDITSAERIKFYIGVYEPINNGDPALFPETHPLAPQSPSMHWGWAAGYRFLVYEGVGDGNIFQLHGLGNDNYFKNNVEVVTEIIDGTLTLNIDAEYTEALRDIDVTSGTLSHGDSGDAKKALENFRDYVFGNVTASIQNETASLEWSIYPNPTSTGSITVNFNNADEEYTLQVTNPIGQIINTIAVTDSEVVTIELPESGIYLLSAIKDGNVIATDRIIVE